VQNGQQEPKAGQYIPATGRELLCVSVEVDMFELMLLDRSEDISGRRNLADAICERRQLYYRNCERQLIPAQTYGVVFHPDTSFATCKVVPSVSMHVHSNRAKLFTRNASTLEEWELLCNLQDTIAAAKIFLQLEPMLMLQDCERDGLPRWMPGREVAAGCADVHRGSRSRSGTWTNEA
jgi:hypothetical protein